MLPNTSITTTAFVAAISTQLNSCRFQLSFIMRYSTRPTLLPPCDHAKPSLADGGERHSIAMVLSPIMPPAPTFSRCVTARPASTSPRPTHDLPAEALFQLAPSRPAHHNAELAPPPGQSHSGPYFHTPSDVLQAKPSERLAPASSPTAPSQARFIN